MLKLLFASVAILDCSNRNYRAQPESMIRFVGAAAVHSTKTVLFAGLYIPGRYKSIY